MCVQCMPVSVVLMMGFVYESRTLMSGNESGTAFAREGYEAFGSDPRDDSWAIYGRWE